MLCSWTCKWYTSKEDIADLLNSQPAIYDSLKQAAEYLDAHATVLDGILADILALESGKLDKTSVDDALSTTSTNPVQNAVVVQK